MVCFALKMFLACVLVFCSDGRSKEYLSSAKRSSAVCLSGVGIQLGLKTVTRGAV